MEEPLGVILTEAWYESRYIQVYMNLKLLSIFFLGIGSQILGQTDEAEIAEVVVHGKFLDMPVSKISENITVINREEIRKSPATNVDEMLAQITGFDIRKRGANGVQAEYLLKKFW